MKNYRIIIETASATEERDFKPISSQERLWEGNHYPGSAELAEILMPRMDQTVSMVVQERKKTVLGWAAIREFNNREAIGELFSPVAPLPIRDQIDSDLPGNKIGRGGWSNRWSNQANWDPSQSRTWNCWAAGDPAKPRNRLKPDSCEAEVAEGDSLGLCQHHRAVKLAEPLNNLTDTDKEFDYQPTNELTPSGY